MDPQCPFFLLSSRPLGSTPTKLWGPFHHRPNSFSSMAAKGPADWATWTPGVCPQVQGAETYKRRAELTSNQQGPPPIPAQEAARTTTSHGMAAHTDTDEAPVVRSKYGVRLKSPPSVTFPSGRAATAVDSKPSGEATISKKSPAGLGPSSIRQTSKTIAEACWRYIMFGRCDKSDCNYIHVGRPAAEQQHQSNSQKRRSFSFTL